MLSSSYCEVTLTQKQTKQPKLLNDFILLFLPSLKSRIGTSFIYLFFLNLSHFHKHPEWLYLSTFAFSAAQDLNKSSASPLRPCFLLCCCSDTEQDWAGTAAGPLNTTAEATGKFAFLCWQFARYPFFSHRPSSVSGRAPLGRYNCAMSCFTVAVFCCCFLKLLLVYPPRLSWL